MLQRATYRAATATFKIDAGGRCTGRLVAPGSRQTPTGPPGRIDMIDFPCRAGLRGSAGLTGSLGPTGSAGLLGGASRPKESRTLRAAYVRPVRAGPLGATGPIYPIGSLGPIRRAAMTDGRALARGCALTCGSGLVSE